MKTAGSLRRKYGNNQTSPVLRHTVAQEAVVLEHATPARETTYGEWYQERFPVVFLPMAARALSVSCPALPDDELCLGWNLDAITDEFKLNRPPVKTLTETRELMNLNEVLALVMTTKFVAVPLAIVVDFIAAVDLWSFTPIWY